jgi:subtilase family serine protease
LSPISARSRLARTALTAVAALALAGGSTVAAVASQGSAAHGSAAHVSASPASGLSATDFSHACAITRQAGFMSCFALIREGVRQQTAATLGNKAPSGDGYGPSSLISAYKLPKSSKVINVAVVDAYNDPDAVSNVATYRAAWGLPKCNTSTEAGCLTVTNQEGKTSPLPKNAGSTGWDVEESLDVDMVSAICDTCHIFLVEASAPSTADLGTGVNSAVKVLKADFVSNSYGGSQSSSDPSFDTKYYNHPGDAIVASAGDGGYGVSYPAASRDVTSVGGTTLTKTSTGRGWNETVWGSSAGGEGTGSGCAEANETKPSWQTHTGCNNRIDNDVSADANPNTGVAVYDTYSQGGWLEVGGTSVSSPVIASVFALADHLTAGSYPSSYPYSHTSDLYDVTSGADGTCSPAFLCHAEVGYDGPTGLGTPDGIGAFTG